MNSGTKKFQISSQQKRIWASLLKDFCLVNKVAFEICGNPAQKEIVHEFEQIVNRHHAFRSVFETQKNSQYPEQLVIDSTELHVEVLDLSKEENHQRTEKIKNMFESQVIGNQFDILIKLRLSLIYLTNDSSLLILSIHPMIGDLTSLLNLFKEWWTGSDGYLKHNTHQFSKYVGWQDQLLVENNESANNFWEKQILHDSNISGIGLEHINGTEKNYLHSNNTELSSDLRLRLEKAIENSPFTLSEYLLTCWVLTLWKFQDMPDEFEIATKFNGRNYEEFETINGPLSSVVPICYSIRQNDRFGDLLNQTSQLLEAVACWFPYYSCQSSGTRSIPYGFESVIEVQKKFTELKHSVSDIKSLEFPFKLKLSCFYRKDELCFDFYYQPELYTSLNLMVIQKSFLKTVETVVNEHSTDTSLLVPAIGATINGKTFNHGFTHVLSWFELIAELTPHQVALIFEDHSLTYSELDILANKVANYLVGCGIKAQEIIPIVVAPNELMLAGILGILKTGAAYLPIDPGLPVNRMKSIFEDCNPNFMIGDAQMIEMLDLGIQSISLDIETLKAQSADRPEVSIASHDLAYVIYTSGSTGKPKGVAVTHSSLMNYAAWIGAELNITADDCTLLISSLGFDLSYTGLWGSLTSGGRIIIVGQKRHFNIDHLNRKLLIHNATFLKLTPSHFGMLVKAPDFKYYVTRFRLKFLVIGGEAIVVEDLEKYFKMVPNIQFLNHYGPTETTIGTLFHKITSDNFDSFRLKPVVGSPIYNTEIGIFSEDATLLPEGMAGEIGIAGSPLAAGYVNLLDLTGEKFSDCYGKQFYKTGDRGRMLGDGTIEFLGRFDNQVKINGHRIELGEISHQLQKLPKVEKVAMLVSGEKSGILSISAFYTGHEITYEIISKHLIQYLPEIMIPTHINWVSKIPLLPNGKVDTIALALLSSQKSEVKMVAPSSNIQDELLDAWKEILQNDSIGIDHNFFDLGGDSIRAVQIASRMYERGYKLDIKDIFNSYTIREMSKNTKQLTRVASQQSVKGYLPLLTAQHRFFQMHSTNNDHYNQAVVLEFPTTLKSNVVRSVFQKIFEHHDAFRTSFEAKRGKIEQCIVKENKPLDIQDIQASEVNPEQDIIRTMFRLNKLTNVFGGPLMKLGLMHTSDKSYLLLIVHHLIIDGVSWRILLEDVDTLLTQHFNGTPYQLPLKSDSVKVWSDKIKEYITSDTLLDEVKEWKKTLEQGRRLSRDNEFKKISQERDMKTIAFSLDEIKSHALIEKSHAILDAKITELLVTGLSVAFQSKFGNNHLYIALEGHGRENIFESVSVERTIGWFTSVFPAFIACMTDLRSQLQEVKNVLRGIPNNGFGYGVIKYLSLNSYFQKWPNEPKIRFNYLGQFKADYGRNSFKIREDLITGVIADNLEVPFLIDISAIKLGERLTFSIKYSTNEFRDQEMTEFVAGYRKTMEDLSIICSKQSSQPKEVPEFSYKGIDHDTLKNINELFDE